MNNLLQLKGRLLTKGASQPGPPSLPRNAKVTEEDVTAKMHQLEQVDGFWTNESLKIKPLVSVHYKTVVAKSNRIRRLLSKHGTSASCFIVGAKFEGPTESPRHVITYCVDSDVLNTTLQDLGKAVAILRHHNGAIDSTALSAISHDGFDSADERQGLSKTAFAQIMRDVFYVSRFDVDQERPDYQQQTLVTLYDTDRDIIGLLHDIGVRDVISANKLDRTTISLRPDQYAMLKERAPFLISMSLPDTSTLTFEESKDGNREKLEIPEPDAQPTIGVIDTLFDTSVYFSEWVEFHDCVDQQLPRSPRDYRHGTEVSSIIVDGPTLNPEMDDGCGRFKVRHFGVAMEGANSSFSILKAIRKIVKTNQDIKVWNMSLGSVLETHKNSISPEGAVLDELQSQYDVIFVVAGTNKVPEDDPKEGKRIGAPADSINALVVNAVSFLKEPASYSRSGPILDFFRKPDVAYFGGDSGEQVAVYSPNGVSLTQGTSFAAPWVARKLAFLIQIMGMTRQAAKALLIDAASGWQQAKNTLQLGYGVVPTQISDIVQTSSNEIRFVVDGATNGFETYNYEIPVPLTQDKYKYMARATLCYFPGCDRTQGVDYTDTELDLHFGRMTGKGIKSLNHNMQGELDKLTREKEARKLYRKWDNVKCVGDLEKSRFVPKKSYGESNWGFKIRRSTRQDNSQKDVVPFALVVTLKEMDGHNRIDEFVQRCHLQHWLVNEIDIHNYINLYQEADIELNFDDEQ